MSDKIAAKEAELELLKAEAEFVEKKKAGTVTDEDRTALRELRQAFRAEHRTPKPGASPAPITNTAKAE